MASASTTGRAAAARWPILRQRNHLPRRARHDPRPATGPEVSARARGRCGGRAAVRGRLRRSCRWTRRCSIWHLYQAALAGRDIYYDQRYAHNLEMRDDPRGDPHASRRDRSGDAGGDPALHEAVLAQHRAVQQPDRAQVRAEVHAGGVCRGRKAAVKNGAAIAGRGRARRSTRCSRGCGRRSSTPASSRSSRTRRRVPARTSSPSSANNLYVGVTMKDLDGFDGALSAQLAAREAETASWSRRSTGSAAATTRRSGDRRRTSRPRFPTRPSRWPARCARSSGSTRPARPPTAWRTTSRGSRTRARPWTRSTASSRSTWMRAG